MSIDPSSTLSTTTHRSALGAMMLKLWHNCVLRHPKLVLITLIAITVFLALQLQNLRWETDARVYLPKGHPAIIYDEKVADLFGVKDSLIIGIVNDGEQGIYNTQSLERIQRITDRVASLPGVIAIRTIDVASLSSATIFVGDEDSIGSIALMPEVPTDQADIDRMRKLVDENAELIVGNLVSADGKAAMIRAKLKEGAVNRYMSYWQIKAIIDAETGAASAGWSGNQWSQSSQNWSGGAGQDQTGGKWSAEEQAQWWQQQSPATSGAAETSPDNGDRFYLAGRPVIEVTSGLHAMNDMMVMIPFLMLALAVSLFLVFRTARGVFLPMITMAMAIIWTMGTMALMDIPLYTISTMMPVILVAVSIGDTVHFMSHYYDNVLRDPHRPARDIVAEIMQRLSAPLLTTSVTTAVGFLSLMFAEMPPFIVFGLFTVFGILLSWVLTITLIPAALSLMQPKVGNYLAKRRTLRVHSEQSQLTRTLVGTATMLHRRRGLATLLLLGLVVVSALGTSRLFVDSSWLSDFRDDSELVRANDVFNDKFDGTIFLNMVIEGHEPGTFRNPELLRRIENVQKLGESLPYVGSSRSIVDYIKNVNKTLHAGDPAHDIIPETEEQVGEFLFLLSVSGRPELLDEVIDYEYQQALVTYAIKTDHTQDLRVIIDRIRESANSGACRHERGCPPAQPTILYLGATADRQPDHGDPAVKIGIFLLATLLFKSVLIALFTIAGDSDTSSPAAAGRASRWMSPPLAAGVAIGVGVDYAIHYIFRYRDEAARHSDALTATQATMRSVGKTIVFSACVVTVGFGVLCFSQFPPHAKLGYFVAAYMVISCLVALITLPLLYYFRDRIRGTVRNS